MMETANSDAEEDNLCGAMSSAAGSEGQGLCPTLWWTMTTIAARLCPTLLRTMTSIAVRHDIQRRYGRMPGLVSVSSGPWDSASQRRIAPRKC